MNFKNSIWGHPCALVLSFLQNEDYFQHELLICSCFLQVYLAWTWNRILKSMWYSFFVHYVLASVFVSVLLYCHSQLILYVHLLSNRAVCILANNSWDHIWRYCGLFPHVLVSKGKENPVDIKVSLTLFPCWWWSFYNCIVSQIMFSVS